MNHRRYLSRFGRFLVAAAVGGTAFQLSGCDPAVRDTVLTGLQTTTSSLTGTLIDAFFISLQDDDGAGGFTTNP